MHLRPRHTITIPTHPDHLSELLIRQLELVDGALEEESEGLPGLAVGGLDEQDEVFREVGGGVVEEHRHLLLEVEEKGGEEGATGGGYLPDF